MARVQARTQQGRPQRDGDKERSYEDPPHLLCGRYGPPPSNVYLSLPPNTFYCSIHHHSPPHAPYPWPSCPRPCPAARGRSLHDPLEPHSGAGSSYPTVGVGMGGIPGAAAMSEGYWRETGGLGKHMRGSKSQTQPQTRILRTPLKITTFVHAIERTTLRHRASAGSNSAGKAPKALRH